MATRIGAFIAATLLATSTTALADVSIGKSSHVGGSVAITEAVEGDLQAAGGKIAIAAPVSGKARLAAGRVLIDAPVGGDVTVAAGRLELGPNARLGGALRFHGGRLDRDPGAQVVGPIEHERRHTREFTVFDHSTGRWLWTAGLMVLAGLIAALLPGPSQRMAQELRERPWMAPLLGFIAITCIPVAAVLVMITVIGIPVGVLALLAYAGLLLVGYVCVSVVVGGLLLDRLNAQAAGMWAWRAGAAVLAMLVLALLTRIPVAGGFILFAALAVGVGAIVMAIFRARGTPPAASPA